MSDEDEHSDAYIQRAKREMETALERLQAAQMRNWFRDAPAGQFGPHDPGPKDAK